MTIEPNNENIDIRHLLGRIAKGDAEALSTLYDQTVDSVYKIAMHILGDASEAEDATQDIYIRIWDKASTLPDNCSSPKSWLHTVVRNHCIDASRKMSIRQAVSPVDEATQITTTEQIDERLTTQGILSRIEEIAPRAEPIVRMQYLGGYSYQEISQITGSNETTLRTWVRRALSATREAMN